MTTRPRDLARVLVVGDDRGIRERARDLLEGVVRVEACAGAEEALEALAAEPADLVLSDQTLPGHSGLELLEQIRCDHPGTEFVSITADATLDSALAALRMGAADSLREPLGREELLRVVERVLARRRLLAENARLRDSLRTFEASQALMICLDPGEVFAVALEVLLDASDESRGLALFRRSLPISDGVAFRGFDESEVQRLRSALVLDKLLGRESFDAPRVVSDSALHGALAEAGIDCGRILAVPLHGPETERGVLWLFGDRTNLGEDVLAHAELVRRLAEFALQNAERYGLAKERAFIDDVTEVYNARFLFQATEREIQRAERYGKELSVLFLDLDRFKRVNDQHGHLVGSEVLRKLSRVLQQCIRQIDTLARYGGDEFTILLVDTGRSQAMAIAERIRRTVADTLFEGGGEQPVRLTISIGVATYPSHGRDQGALLDAADKSMYRAKSNGRNCCTSASALSED